MTRGQLGVGPLVGAAWGQSQGNHRSWAHFPEAKHFACVIANVAGKLYMFLNFRDKRTVDWSAIGVSLLTLKLPVSLPMT